MKARNWLKLIPALLACLAVVLMMVVGGYFEKSQLKDLGDSFDAGHAELAATFAAGSAELDAAHAVAAAKIRAEIADVTARLEARTAELRALRARVARPKAD